MLLTTVYLSELSSSETPVVGFGSFVDGFQEQVQHNITTDT